MNIGCGTVYHSDWINLDVHPSGTHVRQWDVKEGLPCGDGEVDACYASHVVEHLQPSDAEGLLRQCHRVLKKRGIIRIVVPDLEGLAREYVSVLDRVDRGDPQASADHEWIVMELLDQMVRTRSGGGMLRYLMSGAVPNESYVRSRIGADAGDMIARGSASQVGSPPTIQSSVKRRLRDAVAQAGNSQSPVARLVRYAREECAVMLCGTLLGRHGSEVVRETLFRTSGECHRWMYDRFSLRQLLQQSGFEDVHVCTAFESEIEEFSSFGLDVVNGKVRKPDSLFMEAKRAG